MSGFVGFGCRITLVGSAAACIIISAGDIRVSFAMEGNNYVVLETYSLDDLII